MKRISFLLILMTAFSSLCHADDTKLGIKEHPLPDSDTSYGYLSYLPPNYDAKAGKHPLVIFLHGLGELGDGKDQLGNLAKHGPFKLIKKDPKIFVDASCIVLAPQGLKSDGWWRADKLDAFLEFALKTYAHDKDRVYLTGLSMGGGSTWLLADKHPKTFAALVPICGASKPPKDRHTINSMVPIWAFHSINDTTVPFNNSELWFNSLIAKKANNFMDDYPKQGVQSASFNGSKWTWSEGLQAPSDAKRPLGITVFPDNRHDSWTRAYQDPKLWEWLFAQKR